MITIQILKTVRLTNGLIVRAGTVLTVPEGVGAALIEKGKARLHKQPGPTERKADDVA